MRRNFACFFENSKIDSTEGDVFLMKEFNQEIVSDHVAAAAVSVSYHYTKPFSFP